MITKYGATTIVIHLERKAMLMCSSSTPTAKLISGPARYPQCPLISSKRSRGLGLERGLADTSEQ